MPARKIAYNILMDIEKNKNYSNLSLNASLSKEKIDDREKGFVTEIVYGVIEKKRYIDYIINKVSKIKVKKMNYSVKTILRMGVYQIVFLDRVAQYAAINESVNMMKKIDKKSSGFVNAVLRNVLRKEEEITNIDENSIQNIAIKYSYEDWIIDKIVREHGMARAKEIIRALSQRPKTYVRINRLKSSEFGSFEKLKEFVIKSLSDAEIVSREVDYPKEALEVEHFKGIEKNEMFKKGYISIQDVSSMLVANVVNPEKNSKVLDLCAAPGGKSTHMAEIMDNTGVICSEDIYDHKIKLIEGYSKRLGIKNIKAKKHNAMDLENEYIEKFDYVLSDVPCSGMGIVRRKPEIKYKSESEVNELPKIQYEILKNAAKYVKKGGVLVYSTCTIFKEENMGVIYKFLSENSEFMLDSIERVDIEIDTLESGYMSIYPDKNDMDGFFICRMKKI